ncbi:MAG: hypothetical protein M1825_000371 [Sarcosagium campestre]|nr:MAG: hypothetical protein M1825_000371 [Sarcosagium campestre]
MMNWVNAPRDHETIGERRERKKHQPGGSRKSSISGGSQAVLPIQNPMKKIKPFEALRKRAQLSNDLSVDTSAPDTTATWPWHDRIESQASHYSGRTVQGTPVERNDYIGYEARIVGGRDAKLASMPMRTERLAPKYSNSDLRSPLQRNQVSPFRKADNSTFMAPITPDPNTEPPRDRHQLLRKRSDFLQDINSPVDKPLPAPPQKPRTGEMAKIGSLEGRYPSCVLEQVSLEPSPIATPVHSPLLVANQVPDLPNPLGLRLSSGTTPISPPLSTDSPTDETPVSRESAIRARPSVSHDDSYRGQERVVSAGSITRTLSSSLPPSRNGSPLVRNGVIRPTPISPASRPISDWKIDESGFGRSGMGALTDPNLTSRFSVETGSEAPTMSPSSYGPPSIYGPPSTYGPPSAYQPPPHRLERRSSAFQRTLRRMENSRVEILCERLNEDWDADEPDVKQDENFEKRLWALTALYHFSGNDPMQDPDCARPQSRVGNSPLATPINQGDMTKDILYLHGDIADSWHLAAKNPHDTIHHLTATEQSYESTLGPIPPNIVTRTAPSTVYPLPYNTGSLDLILSRSLPALVRSTDWPPLLRECIRVVRTGGRIAISVLDPVPRNVGPLLRAWTASHLVQGLERKFRVTQPGALLPFWLTVFPELTSPELVTFAFAAVTTDDVAAADAAGAADVSSASTLTRKSSNAGTGVAGNRTSFGSFPIERPETRQSAQLDHLKSAVGRHFYASLYEEFVAGLVHPGDGGLLTPNPAAEVEPSPVTWWWHDPAIVRECMDQRTEFEICTYWCQKK